MKVIALNRLALLAVAVLLALPAAASAQSAQAPATAAPPAAATPTVKSAEERVERRIAELHAQLKITPAEQQQWDQFAQVMRDNAREMDQVFTQRAQQYESMNAVQNMQSYEHVAETHAQQLQKLVPAFQNLYNSMPDPQKQIADQVFRANAAKHVGRSRSS
jgi:periplasmic protein CpxP/Spy